MKNGTFYGSKHIDRIMEYAGLFLIGAISWAAEHFGSQKESATDSRNNRSPA